RRLIRRLMAYEIKYDVHPDLFVAAIPVIKDKFSDFYPELKDDERIETVIDEEKTKFKIAIARGVKELSRYEKLNGLDAFRLYESYGLPFEVIKELSPESATRNLKQEDFDKAFFEHQEKSRAGREKKFGGHGLILDTGELKATSEEELEKVTRLHTATHLLQSALRQVLGDEVTQMGSDITAERTRFDFTFPRKLTPDEIKQVEDAVNKVIKENLLVNSVTLSLEEAKASGALYMERAHYPEEAKVYYVGKSPREAFSKEICGGPHVKRTGEVGKFIITKEEAVSAGVRRIRAEIN
ncbi:MAG: alanine--tRNA ligase, partial [Candidatus Colwellbacteria bacterium]|nr:alanine--tRNA ligase [Candidatus Colwellbacteria bacterium]